jgi:hypothetical protein
MSRPQRPRIRVGDTIRVEEPDYMYGNAPLLLRVTAVGDLHVEGGEAWVNLRGTQLRSDGHEIDGRERYALVRVAGIQRQPN